MLVRKNILLRCPEFQNKKYLRSN